MPIPRSVIEGLLLQGIDEQIVYTILTTPVCSSPSNVSAKAFDVTLKDVYTDVTATVLSGSASASGDTITCPILQALTLGRRYRVEVKWTCNGNVIERYFEVQAEH